MPGESDVPDLPCLLGLDDGFLRSTFGEDPIGVLHSDHLVMLHEIDMVGLQALERLLDLLGGLLFRAAVDLGHQKDLAPVAVAQRQLEAYEFCGEGEGGPFVEAGHIGPGG